jgi:hypothetical protein
MVDDTVMGVLPLAQVPVKAGVPHRVVASDPRTKAHAYRDTLSCAPGAALRIRLKTR